MAFHKLCLTYGQEKAEVVIHLLKVSYAADELTNCKLYFRWREKSIQAELTGLEYGQHCIIYRPAFFRDMALDGPYFNDFLLNVLCANVSVILT